tara:strand:+ start:687 stop:800 length:114 start_codon:yes stop_codon:yes gene_type:complete
MGALLAIPVWRTLANATGFIAPPIVAYNRKNIKNKKD